MHPPLPDAAKSTTPPDEPPPPPHGITSELRPHVHVPLLLPTTSPENYLHRKSSPRPCPVRCLVAQPLPNPTPTPPRPAPVHPHHDGRLPNPTLARGYVVHLSGPPTLLTPCSDSPRSSNAAPSRPFVRRLPTTAQPLSSTTLTPLVSQSGRHVLERDAVGGDVDEERVPVGCHGHRVKGALAGWSWQLGLTRRLAMPAPGGEDWRSGWPSGLDSNRALCMFDLHMTCLLKCLR